MEAVISLIKCKKTYDPKGELIDYQKLPLRELRKIPGVKICEGFVVEADKFLDVNKPTTEFLCLLCGHRFYFDTKRYIKVLRALKIDFSGRTP